MHQIRFWLGLCPKPCWEAYGTPQIPYVDLRGPAYKGGESYGSGGEERGGQRRGRGALPNV